VLSYGGTFVGWGHSLRAEVVLNKNLIFLPNNVSCIILCMTYQFMQNCFHIIVFLRSGLQLPKASAFAIDTMLYQIARRKNMDNKNFIHSFIHLFIHSFLDLLTH